MYSVHSPDGINVYAAGENSSILHSTNSGSSWSIFSDGTSKLLSITSYINSGNIYVYAVGESGKVEKSTDGGLTWNQTFIAYGRSLNSVFFFSNGTGWIAGDSGTILNTTDNGSNWNLQNLGPTYKLRCIKFSDANTGVACGTNGTILKTTNEGVNWVNVPNPSNRELLSIDISGNTIFAAGVFSTVIKSTDFGNSWRTIDYKILTHSDVNCVYMFDANKHFTCGGGGFIRMSTDGGSTFTFPANPMFGDLYSLFFYDNTTGWAVSRKTNAIIKTTDGGASWNLPPNTSVSFDWIRTLTGISLGSILSYNALVQNVVYTFLGGKLYRSPDIGKTWNQISSLPGPSREVIVSPKDTNKILILGNSFAYVSTDYGVNWNLSIHRSGGIIGIPIEFNPFHPDTLFFGHNDTLYRSTDFGISWNFLSIAPFNTWCDMAVSDDDPNTIFFGTSTPSRIFKSTNGGLNFSLVHNCPAVANSESPSIALTKQVSNMIYHLDFNDSSVTGGIWKSTNGGSNWINILNQEYFWGLAVAFDDPNVITAAFWDLENQTAPLFISSNGGSSFITTNVLPNSSHYNQSILAYDKGNILLQQSDGIYALNITYTTPIGIQPISNKIPEHFSLSQNFPNPFNPTTKIKFDISTAGQRHAIYVQVKIYDILGREVAQLVNELLSPGSYEVVWNSGNNASGVYYYKLETENFSLTKKMILLK